MPTEAVGPGDGALAHDFRTTAGLGFLKWGDAGEGAEALTGLERVGADECLAVPSLQKLSSHPTTDEKMRFSPAGYPRPADLTQLITNYSNVSIARACGVSEQTVRNWLARVNLQRHGKIARSGQEVPADQVERLRRRAQRQKHQSSRPERLTIERVSRIIARIGEEAKVVVRQSDEERGQRIKYASTHDLRRSLAERLINSGVSAETLMVVMRHKDFATTRKFYGAKRAAQPAAAEIHQRLAVGDTNSELGEGLVGGKEKAPRLSAEELLKLKALLDLL